MENDEVRKIYVTGHRNPDIDSLASATALAALRRRQGVKNVEPICPGVMPERAKHLFAKFGISAPPSVNDVYLRVEDVMVTDIPVIRTGTPLFDAVKTLSASDFQRLPVVDSEGNFTGMLSPMSLLSSLLDIGRDSGEGLTGRMIRSSIALIAKVLDAETVTAFDSASTQIFRVYVAAMGVDSFETHLPHGDEKELAVISGDRPEIHLRALQRGIRLLIVTGEKSIEPLIVKEAAGQKVTILHTRLDSASVIRRLKFSAPVESFGFGKNALTISRHDRLRGFEHRIFANPEDVIPVVAGNGRFEGVVLKHSVTDVPPYRMILVDHNEPEQSIPGVEEIPIVEVVDHHRIGMMPTPMPIRFTEDVVGSTCTLVASMYRSSGESLTAGMAGLLLGGIVSDTLDLKSPTTSPLDRKMVEWLEKTCGVSADSLMAELAAIDSPLASKSPAEVIDSDRKTYTDGRFKFSLSQVEETNLELFRSRIPELAAAMRKTAEGESLNFIALMVTDAVRETSELLFEGDPDVRRDLPFTKHGENLFAMPGVLSRKKQLLPRILAITTNLSHP